ncbi:LysR family transcriptional regulator YnfL [Pseudonocardia sp. Ae168_Ps1]|uniref:LysR substrate-binding domain-containing protein n=1 Tax=unclassified Pseudonocardia TaxID=2619320 RepID=UPI00094ABFE5|nr:MULTISPECIES: LysR substrate-binding domain-containing protein [unclassified Pseudonocardia]OLL72309.1 LysR family transcriptional regulator YnfL [Pseudonocardia sp. Ae150A_Ps1]OLL78280.1 LysR family transcriptional regulator YnfL [Pseudonocardia sp. Ae168_Ps1]OLL87593.1 LysR family transcriptional regulator YnfL [Pseudonocardia sp. Ae263_Ps1]OLL92378.1 LysR family transcriptional regulator YnfL [Pseudonocardia sp. Ae356_Ps1]
MDVELRQLRMFLTVASELHFSRAAARMHVSQPALSQQVRTLEKALGTPLFDRTSRATELTPAGRVLLEAAPRVLFEAERARTRVVQAAEGSTGLLAVGSVGTALASIAPRILRTVRARFPDLQMQVSQHDTAAQMVALAEERLDVGLVRAAAPTTAVTVEELVAEPLLVVLPGDHPLAVHDTVDAADLAGESFVLWPRPLGAEFFDIITGYCRDHGFSPTIVAEGADIETQLSLVAAGIGVSLQPSYYANLRPPGVEFRPLSGAVPTVALQVAWRRRDRSAAVGHFVEAARVCAGDGAG